MTGTAGFSIWDSSRQRLKRKQTWLCLDEVDSMEVGRQYGIQSDLLIIGWIVFYFKTKLMIQFRVHNDYK